MIDAFLFPSYGDVILFLNKNAEERGYSGAHVADLMDQMDPTYFYRLKNRRVNIRFIKLNKYICALNFRCTFLIRDVEFKNTRQLILFIQTHIEDNKIPLSLIAAQMGHNSPGYIARLLRLQENPHPKILEKFAKAADCEYQYKLTALPDIIVSKRY